MKKSIDMEISLWYYIRARREKVRANAMKREIAGFAWSLPWSMSGTVSYST